MTEQQEKLSVFRHIWNLVALIVLAISLLFLCAIYQVSEEPDFVRLGTWFISATSAVYTIYQIYKRKPLGYWREIKHEFFISQKAITSGNIWVVNRVEDIVEDRSEDVKRHVSKEIDSLKNHQADIVPDELIPASQAVKNAYISFDAPTPAQRHDALKTIEDSDDPHTITALELAVKHSTRSVRTQAALILAEKTKHQNPAALLGLFEALDEDDFDTCQQSLRSINGTFQENPSSVTPERIEELINFLGKSRFPSDRNMDNDIRWTTEDVLIAHCDKSFPYLITAIRHDSASAKLAVLEAIWIIAENRVIPREQILDAVPALIEALNDGYQGVMPREGRYVSVKNLAQEALVKISPLEILQEYLKNERTWLHPHVKKVIEQIQSTNTQNTN